MKKIDFPTLLRLLGIPALTVLLGLVLLLNPDSAAALAGKVLGGILILVGAGFDLRAYKGEAALRTRSIVLAVICVLAGIWFVMNPLVLVESVGRIIGVLLILRGVGNLASHFRTGGRFRLNRGLIISVVTALAGLVLVIMPLTTSRMLFSICGTVLICIGIADGYDRLRGRKYLDEGNDPNIIDAL